MGTMGGGPGSQQVEEQPQHLSPSLSVITGKFIHWWAWGPGQPSGPDQHCLYLVGGFLGYQWADFHCEFEVRSLNQIK